MMPGDALLARAGYYSPGLGAEPDRCPQAVGWCRGLNLLRGEKWAWVRCGTLGGNLCYWLWRWSRGEITPGMSRVLWGTAAKLVRQGTMTLEEACDLAAQAGMQLGPAEGCGGGGSSSSGVPSSTASAGGDGGGGLLSSGSLTGQLAALRPYYPHIAGGLLLLLLLKRSG